MTIDYSILTKIVYLSVMILTFVISYCKNKNIQRSVFCTVFYYSLTMLIYFIVLPIQIGVVDGNINSFENIKFSDNFILYRNLSFLINITTGFLFSSCGYLVYKKMRNTAFICMTSILVIALYIIDGLITNYYWHDYVKFISVPDMMILVIGILMGFISAIVFYKSNKEFVKHLEKTNSENNIKDFNKDMSEL